MRFLFLILIRCYQIFTPKIFRGRCLYKVSCSNHVYQITKQHGIKEGINALFYRTRNCRPGYYLTKIHGNLVLITKANMLIEEKDISEKIINNYRDEK